MGNFKQNNRSSGRGNSRGFSSGRDSGRREMYKAVCSACGKNCELPFKPTGDKPVFCSDCFRNKRNTEQRTFSERGSGRFNSGDKRMHEAICDKCGKKCEVPFRPTGDKPIYCSECFNKGDKNESSNQPNKQFEIINTKLDKILKTLSSDISSKVSEKKKTIQKIVVSKPKKATKNKAKKKVSPKKVKPKAKAKPKPRTKIIK